MQIPIHLRERMSCLGRGFSHTGQNQVILLQSIFFMFNHLHHLQSPRLQAHIHSGTCNARNKDRSHCTLDSRNSCSSLEFPQALLLSVNIELFEDVQQGLIIGSGVDGRH